MNSLYQYINSDGFVTLKPDSPSFYGDGNSWLQTGLALTLKPAEYFQIVSNDRLRMMIFKCEKSVQCPLIYRTPHKRNPDDQEACDDYWALIYIASKYDWRYASRLYDWAVKNDWYFDVQKPERRILEQKFDRFIAFAPMLKLSVNEPITSVEWACVYLSAIWDIIFISKADKNIKSYIRLTFFSEKSYACELLGQFWLWRIRKKYGSLGKAFVGYFDAGHPLTDAV